MGNKPLVLVIAGATATGKSALAFRLAKQFSAEIISADSAQVYRGMDIGTAKPEPEEVREVPHHLIDILSPQERFDVRTFCRLADRAILDIHRRGRLPIVVGGTGLYIRALTEGYRFSESPPDPELRQYLERNYQRHGLDWLREQWRKTVPSQFADKVDTANPRRLIRSIEIFSSGKGEESPGTLESRPYRDLKFILHLPRDLLREQIHRRLKRQMQQGFVSEVIRILDNGISSESPGLQVLGYREIVRYLKGEFSYRRLFDLLERNTARFAKRQETWFRKEPHAHWLPAADPEYAYGFLCQELELALAAGRRNFNEK